MNNTLPALLNWMRERSRLFDWDMIVSLDRAKYNRLLSQEYIRRFDTQSYLPPISGSIPIINEYKVFIHDFTLDRPRLSFENATLNDSKARLRMSVIAGQQVDLQNRLGKWYVQRLDFIGPLAGPELKLDLRLGDVPGNVAQGGEISLDLSQSDNFELSFADSNRAKEEGGAFFRELFRKLPPAQRMWSAGQIAPGLEPLLFPQSFRLRTQAHPDQAPGTDEGDGAVLGFVRMAGSYEGSLPETDSDFRYLIPDEPSYSATVLLDRQRIMTAELLRQFRGLLTDAEFELHYSEGKRLERISAVNGHYLHPYQEFDTVGDPKFRLNGEQVLIFMKHSVDVTPAPLKNNFHCVLEGNDLHLEWTITALASVKLLKLEDTHQLFTEHDWEQFSVVDQPFSLRVNAHYEMGIGDTGTLQLKSLDVNDITPPVDIPDHEVPSDSDTTLQASRSSDATLQTSRDTLMGLLVLYYVFFVLFTIRGHLRPTYETAIRARLAKDMPTGLLTEALVHDTVRLSFGGAVIGHEVQAPNDIGLFGAVSPSLTTFDISPLEPVMVQGTSLQFISGQRDDALDWALKWVDGATGNVGSITHGNYQAPPASAMDRDYLRVRVTATDPVTNFASSALVTVMRQGLDLSPLVEVCPVKAEVVLTAGSLTPQNLSWRILGDSPHGSLSVTTGARTHYVAGEGIAGAAFFVEQVEVQDSVSRQTHTTCVITRMATSATLSIAHMDLVKGEVQLELYVNNAPMPNAAWSVLVGPGSFDADTYRVDPLSDARFVVLQGLYDFCIPTLPPFADFIVLPLPLADFEAEMRTLCAHVVGTAAGQG
ncbi:hypothetical protein [Pseudomonas sp. B21-047]|uniref:hypothetical protein n=1 Tax=Pseudomonas sp. B21-047 TaxID=2895489 RepID=UPI0021600A8C|nr:hypothetical protein [Pseudomonas sp. B21-047]UVL05302.1 hypothetical protein LOY26_07085 [Pseudomonas sp. B21-047]